MKMDRTSLGLWLAMSNKIIRALINKIGILEKAFQTHWLAVHI